MPNPALEITSLTSTELIAEARARLTAGHGAARGIYKQVMHQGVFQPGRLGLGERAQQAWQASFRCELPRVVRTLEETGETGMTAKAVLSATDGLEYECVLLPMGRGRQTLCVSSQVGCKLGCRFCETGRMGLLRNLSAAEIVSELLVARHVLGWDFRNVVFMGMGEALDNPDALERALRVITDPMGLGLSQERITVCTVGRPEGIERLRRLGMRRLNLSISLNAANDALRSELMPINRRVPLAELQETLVAYRPRANFVLGVNYCLLPGLNDRPEHAREVADFCRPIGRVMVNVIPYNPGTQPLCRPPSEDEIDAFIGSLRDAGLPVRRRVTKGRTLMAACGQLGNLDLRKKRKEAAGAAQP